MWRAWASALGGRARQLPWTIAAGVTALFLTGCCAYGPPTSIWRQGKLQPAVRQEVFAMVEGEVIEVPRRHGKMVDKGEVLARMQNLDLDVKLTEATSRLDQCAEKLSSTQSRLNDPKLDKSERGRLLGDRLEPSEQERSYVEQVKLLQHKRELLTITSPIDGQIVTWQVKTLLMGRPVQPGQILMSVVEPKGDWELEVQMPEDRMGFINEAAATNSGPSWRSPTG